MNLYQLLFVSEMMTACFGISFSSTCVVQKASGNNKIDLLNDIIKVVFMDWLVFEHCWKFIQIC